MTGSGAAWTLAGGATVVADGAGVDIPAEGILSATLVRDDALRLVRFAFAAGEELTEHTAASPVVLQVVRGRMLIGVDGDEVVLEPGSWMHLPARLPHRVVAQVPSVLLLTLLRATPSGTGG